MKYVLLIPGWFPTRMNALTGDFIERHARAAALYLPVKILYVEKDNSLPNFSMRIEKKEYQEDCEATIVYYAGIKSGNALERLSSIVIQWFAFKKGYANISQQFGLPSIIHAHVIVAKGWFALWLKKKIRKPLVVSEQWTGYLPEAAHEFRQLKQWQKNYMQKMFAEADMVTTVSDYLAKSIQKHFAFSNYKVIPNLVDTDVFKPDVSASKTGKFIHISTLSYQKNFDWLIDACVILKQRYQTTFELIVVGPPHAEYQQKIKALGLSEQIIFMPETSQQELYKLMCSCQALILCSRYETFGCVIVEANACGIPVIVSDHPVFNENVAEGITGFHVEMNNAERLAETMHRFCTSAITMNKQEVAQYTETHYSMKPIGKEFADVYQKLMQ